MRIPMPSYISLVLLVLKRKHRIHVYTSYRVTNLGTIEDKRKFMFEFMLQSF